MKNKLKCYISAPANFDLTELEKVLNYLKVESTNFYDFSAGTSFSDLIKRKIEEVDFIVFVIKEKIANTFYELGIADGLGKPIFILIDKEIKIPSSIQGKLYYQTNFSNLSLIMLALSNFVSDIINKTKKSLEKKTPEVKHLDREETNFLTLRIRELRTNAFEEEILTIIKLLFNKINIKIASRTELKSKYGPDLIIRNNQLTPYFGPQIGVELKTGLLNPSRIKVAKEQLSRYILETNLQTGILLYLDKNDKRFGYKTLEYPSIICLDVEEFVYGVASNGIVKYLAEIRNEIAHGVWRA